MNYNEFFKHIASDNSRLFKIAELEKHKDDNTLKRIIELALNPFINFYIRKIPEYTNHGNNSVSWISIFENLGDLSSRKYTGHKGIEWLKAILAAVSEDQAKAIERIISKDLKCGVNTSTVNKVWSGLIPEYPVMLCSQFEQKLVDKICFPAYAQLKEDGMRANAITGHAAEPVEYFSRNGNALEIYNVLDQAFNELADLVNRGRLVFDGEFIVVDEQGNILPRKESNGILNKANKGTITKEEASRIRFSAWDIIPFDDFNLGVLNLPYESRFYLLKKAIQDSKQKLVTLVPSKEVNSLEEAQVIFNEYLLSGKEGIILKSKKGIWENKRSKSQIKFKAEKTCELRVKEWKAGKENSKYSEMLGSLECESEDGEIKVSVGSGFSDDHRKTIGIDVVDSIIEVNYNEVITNKKGEKSLFLPVFVAIRHDKNVADFVKDIK